MKKYLTFFFLVLLLGCGKEPPSSEVVLSDAIQSISENIYLSQYGPLNKESENWKKIRFFVGSQVLPDDFTGCRESKAHEIFYCVVKYRQDSQSLNLVLSYKIEPGGHKFIPPMEIKR